MAEALTIEFIRRRLPTSKHQLDDELSMQADIMERINSRVVFFNTALIEAKENLAQVEARLTADFREDSNDRRMTVADVESAVRRHEDRLEAWKKWQRARETHEIWSGAYDAWRTKGFNIKALGDLFAAQYFAINSIQVSDRQRNREDGRAALRQASESSTAPVARRRLE